MDYRQPRNIDHHFEDTIQVEVDLLGLRVGPNVVGDESFSVQPRTIWCPDLSRGVRPMQPLLDTSCPQCCIHQSSDTKRTIHEYHQ